MTPSRSAPISRRRPRVLPVRGGGGLTLCYVVLSAVLLSSVLVIVLQCQRYVKLLHRRAAMVSYDRRPAVSSATRRPARPKRKGRKRKPLSMNEAIQRQQQRQQQQKQHQQQQEQQYYNFTDIVLQNRLAHPFRELPTGIITSRQPPPTDRFDSWCVPSYTNKSKHGLLFNKMPKAASSTVSGISLRIAQRYAQRHYPNATNATATVAPCSSRVGHVPGYKANKTFADRDRNRSYLYSTLRDPAHRSLSRVYFTKISQDGKNVTDSNVISWLRTMMNSQFGAISPGMGGFQLAYLSLNPIDKGSAWTKEEPGEVRDVNAVHENVRQVLSDYDMLLLVERLDESLVAMQLLLGLDVADILYLSSKHAGDYYYSPRADRCIKLVKTTASARVGRYLRSREWYAKSYGDYVLHEAASQSLDMTIDMVGRERFEEALQRFLQLRKVAEEQCAAEAIFPCSQDGEVQLELSSTSCYHNDWGCGGPCLDDITTTAVGGGGGL